MSERISDYELVDELGAGGIGTVYRARDTRTGAIVALKLLHPHLARDPDYRHRFELEAQLATGLESPHIVRVLDYGQDSDRHFLVMEYVEGDSLARILKERAQLLPSVALTLAGQTAQALEEAHRRGMVHGDIKPENILVADDGTAKVSDFGLARALREVAGTQRSLFRATPHYAAPELASGLPDIRSDIYSLGIVLYQMLSGRVPFEADTPAAVARLHETAQPPPLGIAVAAGVEAILERCLAKDPDDRYQEPGELVEALRVQAFASARSEGAEPPRRLPPRAGFGRWRWLYGGIGLAGVSAAVIAALLVFVVGDGGSDGAVGVPPTTTRTPAPPALTSTREATAVSTAERSPTATARRATATPTRRPATATATPTATPSTPQPRSPTPTREASTPTPTPEPEAIGRPPDRGSAAAGAG